VFGWGIYLILGVHSVTHVLCVDDITVTDDDDDDEEEE
jgi:hypothetical protein